MMAMFTYTEGSILIRLVLAHLVTDFFLQPDKWVEDKRQKRWRSTYLPVHASLAGILSLLFLWDFSQWSIASIIAVTHYIIDGVKLSSDHKLDKKKPIPDGIFPKKLSSFLIDQAAHLVVTLLAWLWIIKGIQKLQIQEIIFNYHVLLYLIGYLVILNPTGYIIGMFTSRWTNELDLNDSLKDVGRWIGMMERLIILTLVLLNQFAAIGFLVTAKSLLRLIDKPEASSLANGNSKFSSRKHTEYVLVGTFLSFSIALATGMMIKLFLKF